MSEARWSGRNPDKDRLRDEIWGTLESTGVNVGPVWSRIPNFAGADLAALHLSKVPAWKAAHTVKCNPDPPHRVRDGGDRAGVSRPWHAGRLRRHGDA